MTESPLGRCKTQFSIVADAKTSGLPDQGLPVSCSFEPTLLTFANFAGNTAAWDFDALGNALELRFGEKLCEGLQRRLQLKSAAESVETLKNWRRTSSFSHLAFSDCPTEVEKSWRCNTSSTGPGKLNTKGPGHPIRAVNGHASNSSVERLERPDEKLLMNRGIESLMSRKQRKRPLNAGPAVEKGICREAAGHAKALKLISASQKEVSELINGHLVGRKLPDSGKPHFQSVSNFDKEYR
ncbi:hypothetical protein TNCV_2636211 [Trichonephila clavipes]|nr:hypothetical protein TNCV_2636211 [Trichonephila clavipes]